MVSPTLVELAPGRVSRNLRRSPRRLGPYWMPELQSYSFHGVYRRKDRFRQFVQQAPSLACKSGAQRVHARPWISVPIILFCRAREAGGHVQLTSGLYEALPRVLNEAKEKPVIASRGDRRWPWNPQSIVVRSLASNAWHKVRRDDREQCTPIL